MAKFFSFETYLSPFTWRYGSREMRSLWSETHKRRLWRRIWVALAEAQMEMGLVTSEQVADLRNHADELDIERAHEIESEIRHDLMAEIRTYAEQCVVGGRVIHLGATSLDIEDNADILRIRDSLDLVIKKLRMLLRHTADQIDRWAETPIMGFTHLQPAEPTTVGYRLSQYGFDLLTDLSELERVRLNLRGKGIKGAVGTSASFIELLRVRDKPVDIDRKSSIPATSDFDAAASLEHRVMTRLNLDFFPVSTQTYPRKQDWLVINALAGLAGSLYKFAFDLRILQSPLVGEWAEPAGAYQVSSSAMPFKRNPVDAEYTNSLARYVASLPRIAWDNAAHALLERTLDDAANRSEMFPSAYLAVDEILERSIRIMRDLQVNKSSITRTLEQYNVFAATERILMLGVRAGANRQHLHEVLRKHSVEAWKYVILGKENPLPSLLLTEPDVTTYVKPDEIHILLDASNYVGDASVRARSLARRIVETVDANQSA